MRARPKLLIFLPVLLAAQAGLALKLYKAESVYSCIDAALSDVNKGLARENSPMEKRSFMLQAGAEEASSEDEGEEAGAEEEEEEEGGKEKRTFPATVTRYKSLGQAQGKGKKAATGQAKTDHRAKFTLSLDVPTNLMNILFNIAKAKNMRAKAAANAQLMAQIGRRK